MLNYSSIPIINRASANQERLAIIDEHGKYTYGGLLRASGKIAAALLGNRPDLKEARVAFMVPPGFEYVSTLWGIWLAGGIAVPLAVSYTPPEIEYVLNDTATGIIIAHPQFADKLRPLAESKGIAIMSSTNSGCVSAPDLPTIDQNRRAMILYTSGTTSKPKGVVTTHANITAQIIALIDSWEWTADDRILNVLPLHHTHGIINVLSCAMWAGAACEMLPKFETERVWERFTDSNLTLFMAVPTIYIKLIAAFKDAPAEKQAAMTRACRKMRLMVSGSAALPPSVFEEFKTISGHELLERYGMTEIGMAISNPLHGKHRPGFVGTPLPEVEVRLVSESGVQIAAEGQSGELQVKGPGVFLEYWGKPEATRKAFREGWFCTGDIALVQNGYYRILGRNSVDIIKTGGYKVSALEIEAVLGTHPAINECAVVGIEDREWGERIGAAVALKKGSSISFDDLRNWSKSRMASYKIPTRLLVVEELPRNAMGKVIKTQVKSLFKPD